MTWKVTGVTRNNAGAALGSCECFLFKYNSSTHIFTQTGAMVTSDSSGNFAFTGLTDNTSAYQVVFYKNGSPNVFDVTDRNLTPVIEPVGGGTTWNPADKSPPPTGSLVTLSNSNMTMVAHAANGGGVRSTTSRSSGRLYFEATIDIAGAYGGIVCLAPATEDFDPNNYNTGVKHPQLLITNGYGSSGLVPQGSTYGIIADLSASPKNFWAVCSAANDWGSWNNVNSSFTYADVANGLNAQDTSVGAGPWFIYALGIGTAIGGTAFGCTINVGPTFLNPNFASKLSTAPYGSYVAWG